MGLFSSNKSSTNNTTNYSITDQSANAAEGAIAAGAGATVNVTTSDAEVALGALASQRDTAGMALAANQNTSLGALAANQNVSLGALDTTARVAGGAINLAGVSIAAQNDLAKSTVAQNAALSMGAINTVAGLAEVSARERKDVLTTTTTALQSQQGLANKIADLTTAALERSQTPDSAVTKQLLWVVGAVAVLGMLFLFGASRRKTT